MSGIWRLNPGGRLTGNDLVPKNDASRVAIAAFWGAQQTTGTGATEQAGQGSQGAGALVFSGSGSTAQQSQASTGSAALVFSGSAATQQGRQEAAGAGALVFQGEAETNQGGQSATGAGFTGSGIHGSGQTNQARQGSAGEGSTSKRPKPGGVFAPIAYRPIQPLPEISGGGGTAQGAQVTAGAGFAKSIIGGYAATIQARQTQQGQGVMDMAPIIAARNIEAIRMTLLLAV